MEEGSTFEDWAWWFGYRLIRGNPNVASAYTRDRNEVYRPSVMYNTSVNDNEVTWTWSDKINFNLG